MNDVPSAPPSASCSDQDSSMVIVSQNFGTCVKEKSIVVQHFTHTQLEYLHCGNCCVQMEIYGLSGRSV